MRRIQGFYREQMQARGYGEKTFPMESDADGELVVHRVDGRHPEIHYEDRQRRGVRGRSGVPKRQDRRGGAVSRRCRGLRRVGVGRP